MLVTYELKWLDQFVHWNFDYWHMPSRGAEEIANWLNDDIQHTSHANDMIDRLRGIQQGKEKKATSELAMPIAATYLMTIYF